MKIESRELPYGTDRSPTTPYFQLSTPNSQLSTILRGLVIKNTGSWYLVKTDEGTYVERCSFLIQYDLHMVAYCHRIGATDTFQAEDAQKGGEEKLQKIHDKYIKQIDDMLAAKDKEIMTV